MCILDMYMYIQYMFFKIIAFLIFFSFTVASPNAFLNEFSSGTVYTSILTQCSEGFEKLRKYNKANEILELLLSQEVFSKHKRGHWFKQYTLNLEYHLGQKDKVFISILYMHERFAWVFQLILLEFITLVFLVFISH